ncbi:AlpA family phage regulatory protein [Diaphorobacter sp. HDW4B]|uniref:helix-turn-helix transcriptional regulator n=1 Tax=Diaphorobacter sp. HDW4B TaxID=2714925 RepID=UPI00140C27AD|nr:AlpA family phage regulatory protein [Diaphorobacter sp. HDW4B]
MSRKPGAIQLVREGSLPKPRQVANRRVAWLRTELESWLISRPHSELLPPENTGASKPRRSLQASCPAR